MSYKSYNVEYEKNIVYVDFTFTFILKDEKVIFNSSLA